MYNEFCKNAFSMLLTVTKSLKIVHDCDDNKIAYTYFPIKSQTMPRIMCIALSAMLNRINNKNKYGNVRICLAIQVK